MQSIFRHMATCPIEVTARVGNVNAAFEVYRGHALLWNFRRMRTWISPGTIGTVISPTANADRNVHEVNGMTKDDKQTMDTHGMGIG